MLDTETKRRIDTARDILVGRVPDPKSQVEQITIALIYKFMGDMDAESEEFGGNRTFFTGEFAKYDWAKVMSPGVGGHEMRDLYMEGIARMRENPSIPLLFRNIFRNYYLPFADPETLKSFLKVIGEFRYDHSERLGDAFEYLLSVLGSQGDAGQFRTPRNIIEFIVDIIDPKKDERILDPACGTAGFLISSYKHILAANTSAPLTPQVWGEPSSINVSPSDSEESTGVPPRIGGLGGRLGDLLTPDEKGQLAQNITGYDISPDMVRLSLVNLYLHGFPDPHITEYDTLTSDTRWNETADVILANPPFMSPKGGIQPHNKFSIKAKRSEVLFVDYMAEHLTPTGRAGIIVPEGIIFQSQTSYVDLRKMLVKESLVAVVSLPAGVFNPYSGVKTSVLILDKALARHSDTIAFFKVENDGYGLGAQRREGGKNDLPHVEAELAAYLNALRNNLPTDTLNPAFGLIVPKAKIHANKDYNLSGERYREGVPYLGGHPLMPISDLCDLGRGRVISKEYIEANAGNYPVYSSQTQNQGIFGYINTYDFEGEYVTWTTDGANAGTVFYRNGRFNCTNVCGTLKRKLEGVSMQYLALALGTVAKDHVIELGNPKLMNNVVQNIKIPVPPIELQKEIVAEIEGYQRVIDGARAVLDNYRPHIPIDPAWELVELGEVCSFRRGPFGGSLKKEIFVESGYAVYEQSHAIGDSFAEFRYFIDQQKFNEMRGFHVCAGDLIMSCSGTMGKVAIVPENAPLGVINQALLKLTPTNNILGVFLKHWMESDNFQQSLADNTYGAAIRNVASVDTLKSLRLPLPPLEVQQEIVKEIEAEQALVAANRELIARFERKIQTAIARVWGEPSSPTLLPDTLVPRREKGDANHNADTNEIGQEDANDAGDNDLGGIFKEQS